MKHNLKKQAPREHGHAVHCRFLGLLLLLEFLVEPSLQYNLKDAATSEMNKVQ